MELDPTAAPTTPAAADAAQLPPAWDMEALVSSALSNFAALAAIPDKVLQDARTAQGVFITSFKNDCAGDTLMHRMCRQHAPVDVLRHLVDRGVSIEARDANGATPIILAAEHRNLAAVRFLVSAGADLEAIAFNGAALFYCACFGGDIEIVRYLAEEARVDTTTRDSAGRTPFYRACLEGHLDIARYLFTSLGADPNIPRNDGWTPFVAACYVGHLHIARYLAEELHVALRPANPVRDPEPADPDDPASAPAVAATQPTLSIAESVVNLASAKPNPVEVYRYLIEDLGFADNAPDHEGMTPLLIACFNGHVELCRYLLDRGVPMPLSIDGRHDALYYAANKAHLDVARLLVERGHPITDAAFMEAAQGVHAPWPVAKFFVERGFNWRSVHSNRLHLQVHGRPYTATLQQQLLRCRILGLLPGTYHEFPLEARVAVRTLLILARVHSPTTHGRSANVSAAFSQLQQMHMMILLKMLDSVAATYTSDVHAHTPLQFSTGLLSVGCQCSCCLKLHSVQRLRSGSRIAVCTHLRCGFSLCSDCAQGLSVQEKKRVRFDNLVDFNLPAAAAAAAAAAANATAALDNFDADAAELAADVAAPAADATADDLDAVTYVPLADDADLWYD